MAKNNIRDAIVDMASGLQKVFKDYSIDSRRNAWKKLVSEKGKAEIEKLLTNPFRPLNKIKILQFAEWFKSQKDN